MLEGGGEERGGESQRVETRYLKSQDLNLTGEASGGDMEPAHSLHCNWVTNVHFFHEHSNIFFSHLSTVGLTIAGD